MNTRKIFPLVLIVMISILFLTGCTTAEEARSACLPRALDDWNLFWFSCQKVEVPAATTCATCPAPTLATDSNLIYLIGGKLINDKGVETVSVTTLDYVRAGTPMQMFYRQLVPTGFTTTISINSIEEILNDGGSQWLVYQLHGVWMVLEVSRDFNNPVNFSQISWLQLVDGGIKVCTDDKGTPGTWIGDCAGSSATYSESYTLSQMQTDPDFSPYYNALVNAMDGKPPFNGKLEIKAVFTK